MASPSDDNIAYTVYVPIAIFFVICPVAVSTKLWSRTRNGGTLGFDDLTNVLALVFSLATGAVLLASCAHGYGRHWNTLPRRDQYEAMKFFYISQVTYKTSINLTKASILLLYLRIFGSTIRWFKWACSFVLICIAMYWVASIASTLFQCIPIQKSFDHDIPGICIDNGKFWYSNAGFSIATDLVILFLPMVPVSNLKIPKIQKMALIFVFALGIFVVITSCLRITTIDIQAKTRDKTYDISSTMWTVLEMNVAIVCSCLPQLRPLVVKLFPRLMPSYYFGSRERGTKLPSPGVDRRGCSPFHEHPFVEQNSKAPSDACKEKVVPAHLGGDIHQMTQVSVDSKEDNIEGTSEYVVAVSSNDSTRKQSI